MRNVIKNILSNWRNIFGRATGFPPGTGLPYSFRAPGGTMVITMFSGYNVPFNYDVTFYAGGVEQHSLGGVTVPLQGFGIYIPGDAGSTCTITAVDGDCAYLDINGTIIFDNL